MYHYDDLYAPDACPVCGVRDLGYEMSDERLRRYIDTCPDREECEDCECPRIPVTIRVVRDAHGECDACGDVLIRHRFSVRLDGREVKLCGSMDAADAYVAAVFPHAEDDRDDAWESERFLRMAEGWGC